MSNGKNKIPENVTEIYSPNSNNEAGLQAIYGDEKYIYLQFPQTVIILSFTDYVNLKNVIEDEEVQQKTKEHIAKISLRDQQN